jgi:hypothetical protein
VPQLVGDLLPARLLRNQPSSAELLRGDQQCVVIPPADAAEQRVRSRFATYREEIEHLAVGAGNPLSRVGGPSSLHRSRLHSMS